MIRRVPGVALYAQIAGDLRARIDGGTYGPGALLPSEQRLADDMDVSVNTIRRALQLLRSEGLVQSRTGYGTRVAIPEAEANLTVVALQRGSRCRIRPASAVERDELGIEPGVPVLEVRFGATTRVYAGDRSIFTIA